MPIFELIKLPNINYANAYDFSNMYSFSKVLPFYRLDWNEAVESQLDFRCGRSSLASLCNFPCHLSGHMETNSYALDMRLTNVLLNPN